MKTSTALLLLVLFAPASGRADDKLCTYDTWDWSTKLGRSDNHRRVNKKYSELTAAERDERSGCTVCEQDQVWVKVQGAPRFRVCVRVVEDVMKAVREMVAEGFPIETLRGYRVGRSKGELDANGFRTAFSNHSFGVAVDINRDKNGLYGHCLAFGPRCRLVMGGEWDPAREGSITRESPAYRAMKRIGWGWGGELEGWQKDFMHFSLTGD